MTFTELIIAARGGREMTPYQRWCLEEIEKKGNYQIAVDQDGTATVYGKKK